MKKLRKGEFAMYEKVSTNLNFVEREKKVEPVWKDSDLFQKGKGNR